MASLKGVFPGPFAGPETQIGYEAALGKFLVAFNQIDNGVRRLIKKLLDDRDRSDLWPPLKGEMYVKQVRNLQLIALGLGWFPDLPYRQMIELNRQRNLFAHGHYDQDLFSDSFQIVDQRTGEGSDVTIVDLKAATEDARDIVGELDAAWAHIWFEPPDGDDTSVSG